MTYDIGHIKKYPFKKRRGGGYISHIMVWITVIEYSYALHTLSETNIINTCIFAKFINACLKRYAYICTYGHTFTHTHTHTRTHAEQVYDIISMPYV